MLFMKKNPGYEEKSRPQITIVIDRKIANREDICQPLKTAAKRHGFRLIRSTECPVRPAT
jgi:hypothetical protein